MEDLLLLLEDLKQEFLNKLDYALRGMNQAIEGKWWITGDKELDEMCQRVAEDYVQTLNLTIKATNSFFVVRTLLIYYVHRFRLYSWKHNGWNAIPIETPDLLSPKELEKFCDDYYMIAKLDKVVDFLIRTTGNYSLFDIKACVKDNPEAISDAIVRFSTSSDQPISTRIMDIVSSLYYATRCSEFNKYHCVFLFFFNIYGGCFANFTPPQTESALKARDNASNHNLDSNFLISIHGWHSAGEENAPPREDKPQEKTQPRVFPRPLPTFVIPKVPGPQYPIEEIVHKVKWEYFENKNLIDSDTQALVERIMKDCGWLENNVENSIGQLSIEDRVPRPTRFIGPAGDRAFERLYYLMNARYFEKTSYANWAYLFNCAPDNLQKPNFFTKINWTYIGKSGRGAGKRELQYFLEALYRTDDNRSQIKGTQNKLSRIFLASGGSIDIVENPLECWSEKPDNKKLSSQEDEIQKYITLINKALIPPQ